MPSETGFKYSNMVSQLKRSPSLIASEITDSKMDAIHMALGIGGESGELVDVIKKWVAYGTELDLDNVIKEMGDLEFYLEGLRQCLNIDRSEVLYNNYKKLEKRYMDFEFTQEQAVLRADVHG